MSPNWQDCQKKNRTETDLFCSIPLVIVVFTRQLEILVTSLIGFLTNRMPFFIKASLCLHTAGAGQPILPRKPWFCTSCQARGIQVKPDGGLADKGFQSEGCCGGVAPILQGGPFHPSIEGE